MSDELDLMIQDIQQRLHTGDPTALDRAEQLTQQHPGQLRVWFLAAAARSRSNLPAAVAAMTRAIEIGPSHPELFFFRGSYELNDDHLPEALRDFEHGLALYDQGADESYSYRELLQFFRADVLLALGRRSEARAALAHVRDDFRTWTTTLRTKAEMLAECDR